MVPIRRRGRPRCGTIEADTVTEVSGSPFGEHAATSATYRLDEVRLLVPVIPPTFYAAVKSALEGMSASLVKELRPLGISVTAVEPGGFRTDFAGRSLMQSATVVPDYAETAGPRRKENDTANGRQPGDPARAAQAIIAAVTASAPPALLVLGRDAVTSFGRVLEAQRAEFDAWRELSCGTDLD